MSAGPSNAGSPAEASSPDFFASQHKQSSPAAQREHEDADADEEAQLATPKRSQEAEEGDAEFEQARDVAESSRGAGVKRQLFRGQDDDDNDDYELSEKEEDDDDMELVEVKNEAKAAKKESKSSNSSKRRRLDSVASSSGDVEFVAAGSAPPASERLDDWDKRYLGNFIISAWSLSKGTGYITHGDKVAITRQKPRAAAAPVPIVPPKSKSKGKQTKLNFGGGGGGESSKGKSKQPAKVQKPAKEDYIVRFCNMRGFEVGRITTDISVWMSKLLDMNIIHFEGTVVDCPTSLTVGCDILLEIRAYLRITAFPKISRGAQSEDDPKVNGWGAETAETTQEKMLRERRVSLGKLFRACTLRPSLSNKIMKAQKNKDGEIDEAMLEQLTQRSSPSGSNPSKGKGKAKHEAAPQSSGAGSSKEMAIDLSSPQKKSVIVVDDDEDVKVKRSASPVKSEGSAEAEDGTELEEDQLDAVYRQAQRGDQSLPQVEPAEGFTLQLRPYQKQALGWMIDMEKSIAERQGDARELSLHPLWQEYTFPIPEGDVAETAKLLEAASNKFYYNPYTGDLRLEFQRASRGSRGGILADEMGLGKTIQMASLILTNQPPPPGSPEAEVEKEDVKPADKKKARQVSLYNSFAAVKVPRNARKAKLMASGIDGRATLVIAPMSLIGQWRDEMERAIPSMQTYVYYADSKADLLTRLEGGDVDIVITSYGTLLNESKSIDKGAALFSVEWLRVILDEAHTIKNRTTHVSKACFALNAQRRWALTGTPIVNRLTDLYSLLRFLHVEPWSEFSFFNTFISKPFANKNPRALSIVQVVLESVLLRREKRMKDKEGNPIVQLPNKNVEIVRLNFSPLERAIYDSVYRRAAMQYKTMASNGTLGRNYSYIFSVLMRLRQAVCHPLLVLKAAKKDKSKGKGKDKDEDDEIVDAEEDDEEAEEEAELKRLVTEYQRGLDLDGERRSSSREPSYDVEALTQLLEAQGEEQDECPLCFESEMTETCIMPCKHMACRPCLILHLEKCEERDQKATCPTCRYGPIRLKDLIQAVRTRRRKNKVDEIIAEDDDEVAEDVKDDEAGHDEAGPVVSQHSQPAVYFHRNDFRSSAKLDALIESLNKLRFEDPTFKGVIFSQFTSFLDLIEVVLKRHHHPFVRLDGTTAQAKREAVLKEFAKSPKRILILVSLRAGGVGLNLTAANHVYLMDIWWNAAIEQQAIDRIHRLGQLRDVFVHRFVIDESIEDRILAIQARKTALVGAALAGSGPDQKSEAMQNLELLFSK